MARVKQFNLPDPGEGLVEAEIVTWKVKVGDTVKVNDIVVEIETAKSLVELPVPFAGTVTSLLVEEGQTVEEGQLVCIIEAMKMENEITAHKAGVVERLEVKEGDAITAGATIAVIKSDG